MLIDDKYLRSKRIRHQQLSCLYNNLAKNMLFTTKPAKAAKVFKHVKSRMDFLQENMKQIMSCKNMALYKKIQGKTNGGKAG